MNIKGSTLSLTPVLRDSVWYIEWGAVSPDFGGDKKALARWSRFSTKNCAGKDGLGKYYDSKKHAMEVIRAFNAKEMERLAAAEGRLHTEPKKGRKKADD